METTSAQWGRHRRCVSQAHLDLNNQIRTLWEQHIFWTRMLINSAVFNTPDLPFVTQRLLRNPLDFQALLEPVYGRQIASGFATLFTAHLTIAAELVQAAIAGNAAAAADAERRWYQNAEQIAAFLAHINPFWSEAEWRRMLFIHLALTKDEAVAVITGNYAESIALLDRIEAEALEMADMMTEGLVKQFPRLFG